MLGPNITSAIEAEGFLTVQEFGKQFKLGKSTIYEELGAGRLTAKKVRGRTLIPFRAAQEWAQSHPDWKSTAAT